MSEEFEPYPYAPEAEQSEGEQSEGEAAPKDHVILVVTERGGQGSFTDPNHASEPMTKAQALSTIEQIAQRRQNSYTLVEKKDRVIQVSDAELVIFRSSAWTGDRVTRVICGRSR